jgi:hypothetical protein
MAKYKVIAQSVNLLNSKGQSITLKQNEIFDDADYDRLSVISAESVMHVSDEKIKIPKEQKDIDAYNQELAEYREKINEKWSSVSLPVTPAISKAKLNGINVYPVNETK